MRLYSVTDDKEGECVLVVANDVKEARKIGLPELTCDFINASVRWIRNTEVESGSAGIYKDYARALKEGWYSWAYANCPICKENEQITYEEEKEMFYCPNCKSYFKEF